MIRAINIVLGVEPRVTVPTYAYGGLGPPGTKQGHRTNNNNNNNNNNRDRVQPWLTNLLPVRDGVNYLYRWIRRGRRRTCVH